MGRQASKSPKPHFSSREIPDIGSIIINANTKLTAKDALPPISDINSHITANSMAVRPYDLRHKISFRIRPFIDVPFFLKAQKTDGGKSDAPLFPLLSEFEL